MNLVMKKQIFFLMILALTGIILHSCQSPDNDRLYVSKYKGVFRAAPQKAPTLFTPDGPIAGNGDVGILYSGPPEKQCIYFSKNDFWRSKPGYPDGAVSLVGGLNINVDALAGARYYAEQLIHNGTIKALFQKNDLSYRLNSWVAAGENVAVVALNGEGEALKINLDLWPKTGNESKTESGQDGDVYWFTRIFDSPELEWPTHIAVAMKILGAAGKNFTLNPSEKVKLVIAFCTNHDDEDYFNLAIQKAKSATENSLAVLRAEHVDWWKDFWSNSQIRIGDSLMEKYYYGSQYLLASCSRNTEFPPGLWGNSLSDDAGFSNWEGDYHLNYNHQAPWWGVYSSNQVELSDPYDAPLLDYMENGKKHAKELLNCGGIYYPVGIGPKGFCASRYPLTEEKMLKAYRTPDTNIEGGFMFCGQKSHTVFSTVNMFMRFYHTYDTAYARKVYPFLIEVANFWEDYLKFENGRYVIYNDNFTEVGPWLGKNWDENFGDINPSLTLGMLRMFFSGITEVSSFLSKDLDRHEKWQHILDNLSEIPTVEVDGMTRIPGCEGGTGSGRNLFLGYWGMHGLIYPSDAFGIKRNPGFVELLRDEIGTWNDELWMTAIINTIYPVAVRCGYPPEFILGKLTERIKKTSFPNLWIPQPGGGVETFSAVPATINEMLIQSYEGMIRLFPAWPRERDAEFKNLRTYGAFLVSSGLSKGEVLYVNVFSERGRKCVVENPWAERRVNLLVNGKSPIVLEGGLLEFETHAGDRIVLEPFN
jgi:hypothetical protein